MLNYTTTTLVNSADVIKYKAAAASKAGLIDASGNKGGKFYIKYGPMLYIDSDHTPRLLSKKAGYAAQNAAVGIEIGTLSDDKYYRLTFYVRLRNNNSSLYSNNWTFKGKPFSIEFKGSAINPESGSSATKYTLLAELIEKSLVFEYGTKVLKATTTAPTGYTAATGVTPGLYVVAQDQWQMFMTQDGSLSSAVLAQVLEAVGTTNNPGYSAVSGNNGEEWTSTNLIKVSVDNGKEGFGDFAHIIKDLRLPTAANTRWEGVASAEENDDKPQPGKYYTLYTIQYDAERGIQLQSALGGLGKSRTTHVFFVESSVVSDFDAALIGSGIVTNAASLTGTAASTVDSSDTSAGNKITVE